MKPKPDTFSPREEFKRHKKDIEELYQRKLKALYELYPEFAPIKSDNGTVIENKGGYGKLSQYLKQIVEKHHEAFSLQDMQKWLIEVDPVFGSETRKTSIYNGLSRMTRKGKLEKLPDGGYRKK